METFMKTRKKMTIMEKLEIFGHGPWINEDDEIEFVHTGIHCRVSRSRAMGCLIGVCDLPSFFRVHEDCRLLDFVAHKEGRLSTITKLTGVSIKFACFHEDDLIPSEHRIEDETKTYRTMEYCIEQCKYLAEQIVEAYEPHYLK